MKIAFLSWFNGDVYRGVETFVHELANQLVDLGHEVIVYQHGAKLPNAKYEVNFLKSQHLLPKLDRDIAILYPFNGDIQVWVSKIWCLVNGKRLVIGGHSGPGLGDRLKLMAFPDIFIALSDFQMDWAKRCNPFVPRVKIPDGVDCKVFKPGESNLKIDLPKPIVLTVSALDKMKRPELIIRAVAKTKASLFMVGKGDQIDYLKDLGNKLLPGRFCINSYPYEKMPEVYKLADLFAYSTVAWESFGMVLLEAMATNLPIVVSDDLIRKEIIGDAGFTVDVTDESEFAKKIIEALEKDWGDIPRQRAKKFSWEMIAKQYDQIFHNLTGL